MPEFKAAYLIYGDDHGRIKQRRSKLIELAYADGGESAVELLTLVEADTVAAAMNTPTFALGRRFIVVDGVQRWKAAELKPLLDALADPLPDLTVALFGFEEGRSKVPEKLIKAVTAVNGQVATETAVKPWQLPQWAVKQAAAAGLNLESDAAVALVEHAQARPQRVLRELEKLSLVLEPGAVIDYETVQHYTDGTGEQKVWALADDLLSGDLERTLKTWIRLLQQDHTPAGLVPLLARRLRLALETARKLDAGESTAQLKSQLKMPPKAADRFIRDLTRIDHRRLALAVSRLAEVELTTRGAGATKREGDQTLRPTNSQPETDLLRMMLALGSS